MNTKTLPWKSISATVLLAAAALVAISSATRGTSAAGAVARGKYLVDAIGCADCHTQLVPGPNGLERDPKRHLAGHSAELVMPPAPELPPGPWMLTASGTMTAWSGPWGTSFSANLTPDRETGLGTWTAEQFVETIRNQRHMGRGRPLLPPMPASIYANLNDEDLRSIFAYLQSIPAVSNRVPQPLPPPEAR